MGIVSGSFSSSEYQQNPKNTQNRYALRAAKIQGERRFTENGGYGKAMNVGLDKATGEYIGIVEPDDYVPLAMYEDLYKIAKENDLDMVKADFNRFTRNPENGNMNLVYNHLDLTGNGTESSLILVKNRRHYVLS